MAERGVGSGKPLSERLARGNEGAKTKEKTFLIPPASGRVVLQFQPNSTGPTLCSIPPASGRVVLQFQPNSTGPTLCSIPPASGRLVLQFQPNTTAPTPPSLPPPSPPPAPHLLLHTPT